MTRKKKNSTLWYSLGLVLLLCIALPVMSIGTAFARYRTDEELFAFFRVEEEAKVEIGTITVTAPETEGVEEEVSFSKQNTLEWKSENGRNVLTFSVANGASETESRKQDQRFRLCIIGGASLGGESAPVISLIIPSEDDSGSEKIIKAAAEPIGTNTLLYHQRGAGWIFTFFDENGEEIYWDLPGGRFSYVTITVSAAVAEGWNAAQIDIQAIPEIVR